MEASDCRDRISGKPSKRDREREVCSVGEEGPPKTLKSALF